MNRRQQHVSASENKQRAEVRRADGGGQQGGADPVLDGRDGAAVCRDRGDADAVDEGGMSMADIEKVIRGLEECSKVDFNPCIDRVCPYAPKNTNNFCNCRIHLLIDALELLKEYKAIKETISDEIHETAKMFRRTEDDGWIERCDRRARQSLSD